MIEYTQGIYDISDEYYHNSVGLSRSALVLLKKSPFHYWHRYINPNYVKPQPTYPMLVGSAMHTYLIEPSKWYERFIVANDLNKVTKAGKQYWKEIEERATIENKKILKFNTEREIFEMGESLLSDDTCSRLLGGGQIEKSIYWNDPDTGLLCKCRPDIWKSNMVIDVKTTSDASESEFQRSIVKYGYHVQCAMMQEGIYVNSGVYLSDFIFLCVETDDPHAVAIYKLDAIAIEKGRDEFKKLQKIYKENLEKYGQNKWPSYNITNISLPAWYKSN